MGQLFNTWLVFVSLPIILLLSVYSCTEQEDPVPVLTNNISKGMIIDTFQGEEYAIYANGSFGTMQAYSTTASDGTHLDLELLAGQFPTIMKDQESVNVEGEKVIAASKYQFCGFIGQFKHPLTAK